MGRTAMPALPPHGRLLDAARQARLDRRAEALGSCRIIEERRRLSTIERDRVQLPRNLLELVEHLREHASPSGWAPTGEAALTLANIRSLSSVEHAGPAV